MKKNAQKKKTTPVKKSKKTKTVKTSVKLSDLAKELKLTTTGLISKLSELGIGVSSSRETLDAVTIKRIKRVLLKDTTQKKAKEKSKIEEKQKPEKKKIKPEKPLKLKKQETLESKQAQKPEPQKQEKKEIETETPALAQQQKEPDKVITVKFPITIKDLASKMLIGPSLLIKTLMQINIFATINQLVDEKTSKEVGEKFGYSIEPLPTAEEESMAIHEKEDVTKLTPRPPVVTFMGHVDHGKTSLLDYIRKSKITDFEKGGITQHIGAYRVHYKNGDITFLDTPGHEAFTAMRARGANVTDIVILVVAADDGIKPQTIEAMDHAKAAGVPIIVAINKIDKPNIDIERVKKQLSEHDLTAEDWGGKTITVGVSAKTGEGIDHLLEMLILESELLELKADPTKLASGVVVEGKLSKGGGPIATVLVENGTLKTSDILVCGKYYGKIRALIDDRIHKTTQAYPSMPVEVLGLNGVPNAGDKFFVVESEKKAKEIVGLRAQKEKDETSGSVARKISLEDLYSEIKKGSMKELKIIIKADVQGSLGALKDSLLKLQTDEIKLYIIHEAVGDVNESDVLLASASNAIIIGLHIAKSNEALKLAKTEGVDIKLYSIIYEAVSEIKAALEGMLDPKLKEEFKGKAVIRQVFNISKTGKIAGCYVQKGTIKRTDNCRLIRNGEEVFSGKLSSLKRFKDDVREVAEGYECGMSLAGYNDIQSGDVIEAFQIQKIARKL